LPPSINGAREGGLRVCRFRCIARESQKEVKGQFINPEEADKVMILRKIVTAILVLACMLTVIPFPILAADETIKLTVSLWDGPEGRAPVKAVISRFETDFPHIDVELEEQPSNYDQKIIVGIASGKLPDIFLWWDFPRLVEQGVLEDLTSYIERSDVLSSDLYFPGILPYGGKVGDRIYGLPKDFTPRIIFYNKDNFDMAGLNYPEGDWTWSEFADIGKKLTQPGKHRYGFNLSYWIYNIQGYIWSTGGDVLSPDGKQARGYTDSPETVEAIEWLADLRFVYDILPPSGALGEGQGFTTGNIAMEDNGRWPLLTYKQITDLRFGTVIPPHPEGKVLQTVLHAAGWVMASTCKHKKEAIKLLEYLAGPIGHYEMARSGWCLPAIPSVAEELGLVEDEYDAPLLEAVRYASKVPYFLRNPRWANEIRPVLWENLDRVFQGQKDAKTALAIAADAIEGILASR